LDDIASHNRFVRLMKISHVRFILTLQTNPRMLGKEETHMRRIFMVAIVAANLALTASAALAEGNAYHEPFYLASSSTGPFYPATSNTVRTARAGATTIGAVTGPGISPCPYCAFRLDNLGR